MAKYLDCDPLIEEMRIYKCGEEDYDEGIETAISVCAVFPPANVRSVVLGEWEERRKHKWKRYRDGTIDHFAGVDWGYHNGPLCLKCGFSFANTATRKGTIRNVPFRTTYARNAGQKQVKKGTIAPIAVPT